MLFLAKSMKRDKLEKSGLLWIDFPDFLNKSGRRTVNSDTFIINDLKMEGSGLVIDSSDDDDADVTMVPMIERRKTSESSSSSGVSSQDMSREDILTLPNLLEIRRRSSGMLESLKNLMCLGNK